MGGSTAFALCGSQVPSEPSSQQPAEASPAEAKTALFHHHTLVRVHRLVTAKAAAGVCTRCWHAPVVCICDSLHRIALAGQHRFHILMHPRLHSLTSDLADILSVL